MIDNILQPIVRDKYVPDVTKRLLTKIVESKIKKIVLVGFSENMRWLNRLLVEFNITPILTDWRPNFIGYDCGKKIVFDISNKKLKINNSYLIIICDDNISELKDCLNFLLTSYLKKNKTIYDTKYKHNPFLNEEPFKTIRSKAFDRAKSMIDDAQLFELAQYIKATKNIVGDVAEFGSLYGGSGAIIAEAVNFFGKKNVYLFDSFNGIPKSKFGMDFCWDGAFSDNSQKMVEDSFKDLPFVKVVPGNIEKTHKKLKGPFSYVYIASDTLESGETLLNYIWPKLSVGGIISVCDYGSYPNAIPLTMYVDYFFKGKENEAKIFYPETAGFFAIKTK